MVWSYAMHWVSVHMCYRKCFKWNSKQQAIALLNTRSQWSAAYMMLVFKRVLKNHAHKFHTHTQQFRLYGADGGVVLQHSSALWYKHFLCFIDRTQIFVIISVLERLPHFVGQR